MHGFANPARFLRLARWLTPLLLGIGLLLVGASLAYSYIAMPPDRLMGDSVKILPVHVAVSWLGMGGWTTIAISSLVELVWRHPLAAIAARCAEDRRHLSAIRAARETTAEAYFAQMSLGKLVAFTHAHLFGFTTSFFIVGIPFSLIYDIPPTVYPPSDVDGRSLNSVRIACDTLASASVISAIV